MELLGIWKNIYNPNFNYGEFAIIKNHGRLRERVESRANSFQALELWPAMAMIATVNIVIMAT